MLDRRPHFEFFKCIAHDRSPESTAGDGVLRGPTVSMPLLTSFDLYWTIDLTDSSLEFTRQSMPNLIQLHMNVLGREVLWSTEAMKSIAELKQLRQLTLLNHNSFEYCVHSILFNDLWLNSLATFGLLGQLRFFSVVGITNKSMKIMSQ